MGPLFAPLMLLVPILLVAAYGFQSAAVILGVPLISLFLVLTAVTMIVQYLLRFAAFAKDDPDRLQSEKYRLLAMQQQTIHAKGLRHPLPMESLALLAPAENPAEPLRRDDVEETPEESSGEEERTP